MIRIPSHREPTHPGEMLLIEFIRPMGISQKMLAEKIHIPYRIINEIVNKKRSVSPGIALRLARYFNTSEDFWLNLQLRWDLFSARNEESKELQSITPFNAIEA